MQERQFDGVPDLLDLPGQAADVGVVDVRHLVEQQVVDLGAFHDRERHPGPPVGRHALSGLDVRQRRCPGQQQFVAGRAGDQQPSVGEHVLHHDHVGLDGWRRLPDQHHRLVEQHGHTRRQVTGRHVAADRDPQQPSADRHVDQSVRAGTHHHGVRLRRIRQRGQLLAQAQQRLAGLPQGRVQLLVLLRERTGIGAGVGQPALRDLGGPATVGGGLLGTQHPLTELVGHRRSPPKNSWHMGPSLHS